jgi:hypothetical protein
VRDTTVERKTATLMLVGALVGSTAAWFPASGHQSGSATVTQIASVRAATHAVRGIVKSVGPKSLVITRSSKKPNELTFVLTPATLQTGTIVEGATVSVRYRTEGHLLIATGVTVDASRDGR